MQTGSTAFEIGQSIRYGWQTIKKDFWYFVGIAFIVIVFEGIFNSDTDRHGWGLLSFLVSAWLTPGYLKLLLSYHDGNKLPIVEIFKQYRYFWRVLGATIILGLGTVIGLVLFIVPGIYFALTFAFTLHCIVDKDLGIIDAMKKSAELTRGVKLSLFGFGLTSLGIIILGALCFGVGVFVAAPVVWLGVIFIYRKLAG